jgi:hypothetical protein
MDDTESNSGRLANAEPSDQPPEAGDIGDTLPEDDGFPIGVGDVALDLAQGRPVHVLEATGETAAEWSEANNYELTENYGNSRLGATDSDRVFEVVYCSNAKSEPSKTYAMPESRLLRVETEAADDGRPVYQRVVRDVLEDLFAEASADTTRRTITDLAERNYGEELVDEARELADVEVRIGGDDA